MDAYPSISGISPTPKPTPLPHRFSVYPLQTRLITQVNQPPNDLFHDIYRYTVGVVIGLFILLFGLFWTTTSVRAAEIILSDSVPMTRTPWVKMVSVPQFDPALGVLQSVRLSFTIRLRGEGYYENRAEVTSTIAFNHDGEIILSFSNGDEISTVKPMASSQLDVPAYDGVGGFNFSGPLPQDDAERLKALFNGTSGGVSVGENTASSSFVYSNSADLQRFLGTGQLKILGIADASSSANDSTGNVDYELRTFAAAEMIVTYKYLFADIQLEKTVYLGHDGGASCPGLEKATDQKDKPITYCFRVTNTGETYLNAITISDTTLGISEQQMTLISGTTPLAPNASMLFFVERTLDRQLVNLAKVEGTPTDSSGNQVQGLPNPTADDIAEVTLEPLALDDSEEPTLNKRTYLPLVTR